MPDNIYPDQSNNKFDIKYARLLGLSSDLRASFGVVEEEIGSSPAPTGFPIETPSDVDTGPDTGSSIRFGVATEDDTATENRSFDLAGAYSFALTQLGNNQFLVDPANGLYQLGAVPVPGSDSGLSYTYLEIDDTTQKIKLQAPDGIVLPGYGYGNHVGTLAKSLGVDAGGNLIEFTAATGGGTVTSFAFTDGSGFDGTVTNSTTTPTLALTTTLTAGSVFFAGTGGAINEDNNNLFFDNSNNILGIGINSSFTATRLNVVDNSVGAASIISFSSTSTAAASNLQKVVSISLSGANSNSNQTTYGINVLNSHTGTGATNVAVYGEVQNGGTTGAGVRGKATTQYGVNGEATSGVGGYFSATSGRAILADVTGSNAPARFQIGNATTAGNIPTLDLLAYSSGSAANGFSGSIDMYLEASDNSNPSGMSLRARVTDVTAATFTTAIDFYAQKSNTLTKTFSIFGLGVVQLIPITATAASAITPAEGYFVFVSNTDATFTSIGPWCYYNSAWHAL